MADTIKPRPPQSRRSSLGLLALGAAGLRPRVVRAAAKSYGPSVTDTSIKIGNFMAHSGPGSSLGSVGKAATAYFTRLNQQGGVNGRSIEFISLDDSYSRLNLSN